MKIQTKKFKFIQNKNPEEIEWLAMDYDRIIQAKSWTIYVPNVVVVNSIRWGVRLG